MSNATKSKKPAVAGPVVVDQFGTPLRVGSRIECLSYDSGGIVTAVGTGKCPVLLYRVDSGNDLGHGDHHYDDLDSVRVLETPGVTNSERAAFAGQSVEIPVELAILEVYEKISNARDDFEDIATAVRDHGSNDDIHERQITNALIAAMEDVLQYVGSLICIRRIHGSLPKVVLSSSEPIIPPGREDASNAADVVGKGVQHASN